MYNILMKALFIFAHPDDETFATGGTIAKLTRAGNEVQIISATTGQAGMTGEYGEITPEELGKIRELEHGKAGFILGVSQIRYLDLMDGEVDKTSVEDLVNKLLPLIKEINPDIVITFEKNGISNHPDHKQISKAATKAFKDWVKDTEKHVRLYHIGVPQSYMDAYEKNGLSNKAFGQTPGVPDENFTTIIDISDVFDLKDKAAKEHKSQKSDWDRISKRMKHVDLKKEYFELIAENSLI